MKGLLKIADCVFSTAAVLAVAWSALLTGCDMDSREGCSPYPRELNVTLPALTVADAVVVEPMGSRSAVSVEDDALFSVGLGPERGADASWERSLSTRADVTLSNVWVLQFDASGATKACAYVGTVAAGRKVQATLQSGENYTVWIVANGPAEGVLTTSNPATLSDFENKMLHTAAPASDELIPLTGGLSGVRILDNGQVLVGEDNTVVPEMTLTRAMARVDVLLEYDVDGAELDGVWLYQVPAGACYGLDDAVTDYPASGTVSNFAYRNGDTSGLAPTSSGSGTVTHTWYIGDNRRGQNPVIQWEKNKGSNNAPAMATYARIKSHESSDTAKGLFHDVYLGENVTTDFNVLRNRHYIYRVRIGGTLDDQKLLAERDDRVWAGTLEYLDGAPTVDPDLSLPIHVNGQTMRVTFSGYWTGPGIPVRATVVGGEELASGIAACYVGNTGSAMLEIPKNEGGAERQIEFAYEWKGEWNVIGIGTQGGYGVTGAKVTPEGDIPGAGGSYVVTLNGAWEDFVTVRAWDGSKSLVNVTVLTPDKGINFTVPVNESFDSRTVTFQYQWGDEWITIGEPRTQVSGASMSSATVTPAGDIPAEGKTYSLTLTGTIPSAGVEVRAQSGGTALVTGKVTASGTAVELVVPANAGYSSRTVTFEYQWNGTWTKIDDRTQAGYSVTAATHTAPATIPTGGGSYSVTLTGVLPADGVQVRAQSGGTALVTGKVTASGTAVSLAVPANATGADRTVTFEYNWNGTWTKIGDARTQQGYNVSNATHNAPATIPAGGGSYSVTLTGVLPADGVQVRAQSGGTALATGKVTASGTAVSLAVPANTSYSSRSVTFEYQWNGTWITIGSACTQQGYNVSNATHNAPATIPGQGGSYSVTLTGVLPAAGVDVRAQSGGTALVTGKVSASGTAVSLTVPGNLSYNTRTVTFEYLWNGTWTKIGTDCTQQAWNVTAASVTPSGDIPGAGGTYTVTLTGWGGYQIRAVSGSTELVIKTDYTETANYSASLAIPANPSSTAARSVTFQYRFNGMWKDIETRSQAANLKGTEGKNWSNCNTYCQGKGGIPTLAQLQSASWVGWHTDSSANGFYWSCEYKDGDTGALSDHMWLWNPAISNTTFNAKFVPTYHCRCVNE